MNSSGRNRASRWARKAAVIVAAIAAVASSTSAQTIPSLSLLPVGHAGSNSLLGSAPLPYSLGSTLEPAVVSRAMTALLRSDFIAEGLAPPEPKEPLESATAERSEDAESLVSFDDAPIELEEQEVVDERLWLSRRIGAAWIAPSGSNGFAMTDVEVNSTFAPFARRLKRRLFFTPGFGFHSWIGPDALSLPARVFDVHFDINWRAQVTERIGLNLGITPGVYGDFERATSSVFQLTGWGVAQWRRSPKFALVGGVAVVRQLRSHILPVGGFVWTPNANTSVEIVIPRPRIARRLYAKKERDLWAYIAGQFGGGSWAVAVPGGGTTLLTYSDLRLLLGVEGHVAGQLTGNAEVGYVFARSISAFDQLQFVPADAVMLRAGVVF